MANEEYKNYVSENGEYLLSVEWSVFSTIVVKGKDVHNLQEAIDFAKDNYDDIPLSSDNEYIDGSYTINEENAIEGQEYTKMGDVTIDVSDGNVTITQ